MTLMPEDNLAYTIAGIGRKRDPYAERRTMAQRLLAQGMDTSPVQSPWQGAARLAQALMGGIDSYTADRDEKKATDDRAAKLKSAIARMKTDPEGGLSEAAALDPEYGIRSASQLAVEKVKQGRQLEGLNQIAGTYGAPQSTGPIGAGPPLPSGQPNASGFNNNLGNIRVSNANWQGRGAPHNGFETFNTPQDGANAMFANLGAYVKANPSMTVAQAISKWAPPNENDTNLYIRQVMESTGINPAMPLSEVLQDPALAATLMDAMTRKEKGGLPQGVTADTFMTATTPRGAASGPPQPLQVNMPGPGIPPQGATETNGMPPVPSPQGVQGPTMVAPPVPPQRMTPRDMPPQMAAPYIDRLRRGGYGTNPAEAEQRMVADMQRALDVSFENQKLEYERLRGDYEYSRKRGDDRTGAEQKRGDDQSKQRFEQSAKLRDDFNGLQAVKDYDKANRVFRSAVDAAKQDTKASDINMVYAFATLMDPGSVVRDSETGMVYATQGASDRIKGLVAGLQGKSGLGAETKQALLREMGSRYESYKGAYDNITATFKGIAERSGINADDVIIPVAPVEWKKADEGPAVVKSDEDYNALSSGALFVGPDGKTRRKP